MPAGGAVSGGGGGGGIPPERFESNFRAIHIVILVRTPKGERYNLQLFHYSTLKNFPKAE